MAEAKERLDYVDAGKGFSICVVVYAHAGGAANPWIAFLALLIMPLFFFSSGLFAERVLTQSWGTLLRGRVASLMALFVVLTFWQHLATVGVREAYHGLPNGLRLHVPASLLWSPPITIWFLYALAIATVVTKLARDTGWQAVMAVLFVLYCWDIAAVPYREMAFPDRLIRYAPFFLIGVRYRAQIGDLIARRHRLWFAPLAVSAALLAGFWDTDALRFGPLQLAISLMMAMGTIMLLRTFRRTVIVRVLAAFGRYSFLVYAFHRVPLFYGQKALGQLGVDHTLTTAALLAAAAVPCAFALGLLMMRLPPFSWIERHKRGKPVFAQGGRRLIWVRSGALG